MDAPPAGRTRWGALGRPPPGWLPRARPPSSWTARLLTCDWVWPSSWPATGAPAVHLAQLRADSVTDVVRTAACELGPHEVGREELHNASGSTDHRPGRRADHRVAERSAAGGAHRRGKGKSTAAFGMALRAWNQGFDRGVPVVKSAKWKVGEEAPFREPGTWMTNRRRWAGPVAQDGRGLVMVTQGR